MALKKRLIRAFAAIRSYRTRIRRLDDDDDSPPSPPPDIREFSDEFASEFS
jgi:hypothetical protein